MDRDARDINDLGNAFLCEYQYPDFAAGDEAVALKDADKPWSPQKTEPS